MNRVDFSQFYLDQIKPLLQKDWIRADSRRVFQRLSLLENRHRIHLKTYARIKSTEEKIFTRARDLVVVPFMVGKMIGIHNGRTHVLVKITPRHLGYRLGELAYPKKELHNHTSKTKVKNVRK